MRTRLPALSFLTLALTAAVSASPVNADPAAMLRSAVVPLLPEPRAEEPPAYLDATEVAEVDLRHGRYARVIWNLRDAETDAAKLLRAEALLIFGQYDAAEQAMAGIESPAAELLRARLAVERGELERTAEILDAHLAANPESLEGHYQRGQVAERAGDLDAARAAYGWFREQDFLHRWQRDPDDSIFASADDVVTIAAALDRLATLNADYRRDPSLHDLILGMFVRAYDVIDRGHGRAHLAAARFLYERSDRAAAAEELQAAVAVNPRSREALALYGQMQLDVYDFAVAGAMADRLRQTNPQSVEANLLDARSLLLQRQAAKAVPFIETVLAKDENHLSALGLLAASHAARLQNEAATDVLQRVEAIDPDNAGAYLAVGEQLSTLRQYDRAADALRTAVERAPWWTRPRNQLGLLYTQSGEEAAAVATLREAVQLDPFNAETRNYLGLLEELGDYDAIDSEHFVFRYDGEEDALGAELMAHWLDPMHEELAKTYGWAPERPTEIQVFPTHDRFSVRVAGNPYVGTVGACTGPVIALVSPRDDKETMGVYDAARVLRHEYTHTITLGATGNRIWHWMTEGLAVREEQAPPRQGYLELLTNATLRGELFPIEDLTWGFVRPRKPTDRSQAYAQSWYTCEFVAERWGEAKLRELMAASGRGLTEREALAEVLDTTPESFDSDFAAWMQEQLEAWGRDPGATALYEAAVREGDAAIARRDWPAAVTAYQAARQIRPLDEPPIQRLAGLYLLPDVNRPADAAAMLMELAVRSTDDNRFAKRAARLFLDLDNLEKATEAAWLGVRGAPYDPEAHELLLKVAEASGDTALVEKQKERLTRLDIAQKPGR